MPAAVPSQHVDLLREMYGRRTLAEFAESLHPEAEMHQAKEIPDTDDYYGREEFLRGVGRWLEEWEMFRFIPEELTERGELVLMRVRLLGRGQGQRDQARPDDLSRLGVQGRDALALPSVLR